QPAAEQPVSTQNLAVTPRPSDTPPDTRQQPDPAKDRDGWLTYGWFHASYCNALGLTNKAVANRINAKEDDVARMRKGDGKKLNLIAAHTLALADYMRAHPNGGSPRLVPRPVEKPGWFYAAKLARSIRLGLGESLEATARALKVPPSVLERLENGDVSGETLILSRMLTHYQELLPMLDSSTQSTTTAPAPQAGRQGGRLPSTPPMAYGTGYPTRTTASGNGTNCREGSGATRSSPAGRFRRTTSRRSLHSAGYNANPTGRPTGRYSYSAHTRNRHHRQLPHRQ
ncbi:MAG: hypothetical protein DLM55_10975, partial [Acidimicrobiales bacterium]